jgi:diguanylate cyclase (GGDEF)-like protein
VSPQPKIPVIPLPTPNEGMALIIRAAGDKAVPLQQLAKLIEAEPTFTLELLRVANSPGMGVGRKVNTIRHATVALGIRALRNHAIAHVVRVLASKMDLSEFDTATFWENSLRRAVVAKEVAVLCGHDDPMEAFTLGLIQDVGVLMLVHRYPSKCGSIEGSTRLVGPSRISEERRICKVDHARLLARIGKQWNLPSKMVTAILRHHRAPAASDSLLTQIVRVADATADVFQVDNKSYAVELARAALEVLPCPEAVTFEDLASVVVDQLPLVARDLNIRIKRQQTVSELTKQVNRSLVEITSEYEAITQRLRATIRDKERIEVMLHKANAELRRLATTDALTNVSNRRAFVEALEGEVDRLNNAQTTNKPLAPLSVIIFDIDKFKLVNDTYGHEAGNDVLVEIAKRVSAALRSFDLIGRLGGEEFGILLPRTSKDIAMGIAERCRLALEEEIVVCRDGEEIAVTASFGGYTAGAGGGDDWLRGADTAMYEAKSTGRNRISWRSSL